MSCVKPTRVDLGPVEQFVPGQPHAVRAASGDRVVVRDLVVVRKVDEFFAIRDACPHQGAKLSGGALCGHVEAGAPGEQPVLSREGEFLTCPWHGWKMDLRTGRSTLEPETVRVKSYPVHVEAGHLMVEIG
jgi:3-phenylpropionate/trans-cinnamate dioxygenase ferredoxin subunit